MFKTIVNTNDHNSTYSRKRLSTHFLCVLFTMVMMVFFTSSTINAGIESVAKGGSVFARSLVPGPNGAPQYVVFDEKGIEVEYIGEAIDQFADVRVVSVANYQAYISQLSDIGKDLGSDAIELMDLETYQSHQFKTINGEDIGKPDLLSNTKNVAVLTGQFVLTVDTIPLLLQIPFDLIGNDPIKSDMISLLINENGVIVYQAGNSIGFKSGFFEPHGEGSQEEDCVDTETDEYPCWYRYTRSAGLRLQDNSKLYAPIIGARVSNGYQWELVETDENGYWFQDHLLYCGTYYNWYNFSASAEIDIADFNPYLAEPSFPWVVFRHGNDSCYKPDVAAPTGYTLSGLNTSLSLYNLSNMFNSSVLNLTSPVNFSIDVMSLSGHAYLQNEEERVPVKESTEFDLSDEGVEGVIYQNLDYDNDGDFDELKRGDVVGDGIFQANTSGALVGVYLSSVDRSSMTSEEASQPDFTKILDKRENFEDIGLLSEISRNDFQDTDIFVFRESTGELIGSRTGFLYSEMTMLRSGVDEEEERAFYNFMIRGAGSFVAQGLRTYYDESKNDREFSSWQSGLELAPKLHQRVANHIKPGEEVKVVAINRASGYIGTTVARLRGAGDSEVESELNDGDSKIVDGTITLNVDDIIMRPPNLKVWAIRKHSHKQGLLKGESEDSNIAFEGAALTSDESVTIITEWYDENGEPLPAGIGEKGYTGRLSQVSGGSLVDVGFGVSQFSIKPGRHTQVINLPNSASENQYNQHFYFHVSGQPASKSNSFDGDDRPEKFVPIRVKLFDEENYNNAINAVKESNKEDPEEGDDTPSDIEVAPQYRWVYRPEYQFTMYDFQVSELNQEYQGISVDLLSGGSQFNFEEDSVVNLFYELFEPEDQSLTPFSYPKELILAFGEQEFSVIYGDDGEINFDDFDHLSSIVPLDFLSIRLFNNSDTGNILWEYMFEYLDYYAVLDDDILPSEIDGAIEISADDTEVDLVAHLVGFANRSSASKYDVLISWKNDGSGTLEKRIDSDNKYAIFRNTLTLPTISGETSKVTATLTTSGSDDTTDEIPLSFRVVPGEVSSVTASPISDTPLYVGGLGQITIAGVARDQFGNRVADGTAVTVTTDGAVKLEVQPESTINGAFSFSVSGTDYAEAAQVSVHVGDVTQLIELDVNPVDIVFNGLPSQIDVNEKADFSLHVTAGGTPVSGYEFDVWAENGRLTESTVTTDYNGNAQLSLIAPPNESTITVKAMTAMQSPAVAEVTAQLSSTDEPSLNNYRSKMVGDATTETAFNYTRWDNNSFSVNKAITSSIDVLGEDGDTVGVTIGDIFAPNRLTQAAYWMNGLSEAKDEVGFANGELDNVTLSGDTRLFAGNSYRFNQATGDSRVKVADAARIKQGNDTSFVVDIKPFESLGQIFNLGNGLKLELLSDNKLRLTASTDKGTYTATQTTALTLNQWHQVAGSYTNNILTLAVGDELIETPAMGGLSYSSISVSYNDKPTEVHDLVIGEGYVGLVNCLKWFNLASDPLTTFANNTESTSVVIDHTGKNTIAINSLGNMLSFGSTLPMQSIAIKAGDTRQTIVLLSSEAFESIASVSLSGGLVSGAPNFDLTAISNPSASMLSQSTSSSLLQSGVLFPDAHAYDISFSDIMSIAGTLIGLDSMEVIWNQFGNMIAGNEVDIVAFSVALLDVLSLFPPAAPLKLVITPAKLSIKLLKVGNTKAVRYLGGVMKKMLQRVKKGDPALVYQGIAFFIIMADMANDAEAREGIAEIAKMINSTDDFLDILDYFSIADDEITLSPVAAVHSSDYSLFPQAHASVASGIGVLIGKAMKELAPEIAKMGKAAPKALGELGRGIKNSNKQYLKDIAFKEGFVRGGFAFARKVGVSNIRELLTSKHRVGPVTLIAIIAYLESELDDGRLFSGLDSYDKDHNEYELRKLYVKSIPAIAAGNRDYGNFIRNAHGAQFQLLQIGILHALAEAGDLNSKVVGIEVPRRISIFAIEKDLKDAMGSFEYNPNKVTEFGREIDIITGSLGDDEIWREMKSYKANSKTNRALRSGITAWKWDSGSKAEDENDQSTKGNTPHRQFILDRVANETFARMDIKEREAKGVGANEFNVSLDNIYWHFHDFETKSSISPNLTNIKNAFNKEAKGKPEFYKDHVSTYDANIFVMGNIDLFLTNSKSSLAEAVQAEVTERLTDVIEEAAL